MFIIFLYSWNTKVPINLNYNSKRIIIEKTKIPFDPMLIFFFPFKGILVVLLCSQNEKILLYARSTWQRYMGHAKRPRCLWNHDLNILVGGAKSHHTILVKVAYAMHETKPKSYHINHIEIKNRECRLSVLDETLSKAD